MRVMRVRVRQSVCMRMSLPRGQCRSGSGSRPAPFNDFVQMPRFGVIHGRLWGVGVESVRVVGGVVVQCIAARVRVRVAVGIGMIVVVACWIWRWVEHGCGRRGCKRHGRRRERQVVVHAEVEAVKLVENGLVVRAGVMCSLSGGNERCDAMGYVGCGVWGGGTVMPSLRM